MPYFVISIDGGGIRGIYAAAILRRLVASCGVLLKNVELISGTSTGGIIALGLANGMMPVDLVMLYKQNASGIFDRTWQEDLRDLHGLTGSIYNNANLQDILSSVFKSTKLGELQKRVLIPTFSLDNRAINGQIRLWKAKFFHNFEGIDSDGEELAADVALRTSSAPTYFPSSGQFVDGGVIANNPSMAAVAQVLKSGVALREIRLISIGTGTTPTYISGDNLDWGVAQWAPHLIDIMIEGGMGVTDYECRQLLEDNYFRISEVLPMPIRLDDVSRVDDLLKAAAEVDLAPALLWLASHGYS